MRVLVTDAHYKHTLAAVRSLGEQGVEVVAGAPWGRAQAFFSKYCRGRVVYPHPRDEERFAHALVRYAERKGVDVLLPIGYQTTTALSKYGPSLCRRVKLPVAEWKAMRIASDKAETLALAERLNVRTPRRYKYPEDVDRFPVVVKGTRETGRLLYVSTPRELAKVDTSRAVIQEYIPGEGYGFYALLNRGRLRACFMHRRLREYPVTGGPSTLAESVYDPKLKELGMRLLRALNWHGVAMVEFRKDYRDGEYKLMEINPKFWGSLDLSIASGVNFPYLTVKMAIEGDIDPVLTYRVGVRFQWPFPGDLLHVLANPRSAMFFLADLFDRRVKSNIRLGDMSPTIIQLYATLREILLRARRGTLKHPHGVPAPPSPPHSSALTYRLAEGK